jgi:hypothetical protein
METQDLRRYTVATQFAVAGYSAADYRDSMENENIVPAAEKKPAVKRNTPIRRFICPDELWETADRVARSEDRSVSWLIRKAVEEYIERHRAAKREAKERERDQVIASKRSKRESSRR